MAKPDSLLGFKYSIDETMPTGTIKLGSVTPGLISVDCISDPDGELARETDETVQFLKSLKTNER